MKYFIDFEATQYTNEIISIGCVDENGKTFSSYVYVSPKKMTNFITNLTGITKEQIEKAPTADEVFEAFYKWITRNNNTDFTFYCFGDTDIKFIEANLRKSTSLIAICALSIIGMHLQDYSKEVKQHYGLIKNIKLIKLIQYYRGTDKVEQTHDSLEDAFFLKEVYDNIQKESKDVKCPFPEYQILAPAAKKCLKPSSHKSMTNFEEPEETRPHISSFKKGHFEKFYYSWAECIKEVVTEEQAKCPHKINITPKVIAGVKKSINESITLNHKPYGRRWRIHGEIPEGEI